MRLRDTRDGGDISHDPIVGITYHLIICPKILMLELEGMCYLKRGNSLR